MKNLLIVLAFSFYVISISNAQNLVIKNDSTFNTAYQMLLANEINESGEPFAEFLGYNLDDLDPMKPNLPDSIAYTFGIENYEYSRYLLSALGASSGLGLHLMWSPLVEQMAAMEPDGFDGKFTGGMANGYKEDDEFMKVMMHFSMLSNQMPPNNPFPQFADFDSGNMNLPQTVTDNFQMDYSSLRWDRSKMNKTLNLASMGQSMMKQYLWAQDMLGAFHDSSDNTIEADGIITPDSLNSPNFDPSNNVYYGGNNVDGLMGQILTATGISKTMFVITRLGFDGKNLTMIDPMNYNPAEKIIYFPHGISVSEKSMGDMLPPMLDNLTVTDKSSYLFDQISFLRATVGFQNMMNPDLNDSKHLAYHKVFDGNPFPASMKETGTMGPYDLMKGASMVLFQNILAMHYDSTLGSFVDISNLDTDGKVIRGTTISAENVAYTLITLIDFAKEWESTPLGTMAGTIINSQANFILNNLKDAEGVYHNQYIVGQGRTNDKTTLSTLGSIIQSLYKVYSFTGNQNYLTEANLAYNYLISNFYIPSSNAFRTTKDDNLAKYNPFNLAILSGALREASIIGEQAEAPAIYARTFKNIYNKMILAEAEQSGETGNDSDGDGVPYIVGGTHPYVFAAEGELDLQNVTSVEYVNDGSESLNIYPNPAVNFININYKSSNSAFLSLSDFLGRNIISKEISPNVDYQLDLKGLHSGIYLIKTINLENNSINVRKVIINQN